MPHLFLVLGYLLSAACLPAILLANRRPAATWGWIWAIFLFPYAGPLFYFLLGSDRMQRKRLRNRRRHSLKAPRRIRAGKAATPDPGPEVERNLVETLSALNLQPSSSAEGVDLLSDGAAFYDALETAIAGARETVHIEFFIWRDDEQGARFRRLLADAARRGVRVRLLLDEMGCSRLSRAYFRELLAAGGAFSWFGNVHPLRNRWTFGLRNHRKLQIVDGRAAFVGGMNLGREHLGLDPARGRWRDLQVRVEGPVVRALENTFADDWFFATDEKIPAPAPFAGPEAAITVQVVEDGPDNRQHPMALSLEALIGHARRRLWIASGYFLPTQSLLDALKLAAARGVEVRVLVSEKSDHFYVVEAGRSFYEEMLRYGIRVYEFHKDVNHAKVVLVDDKWTSVGSANFDNRSMYLNFELNLVFHDPGTAARAAALLDGYYRHAEEIGLDRWLKRPFHRRLRESLFRPFGPVL